MPLLIINFLAMALYIFAGLHLYRLAYTDVQTSSSKLLLTFAAGAIVAHSAGAYLLIAHPAGLNVNIYNMASVVVLAINATVLVSSLYKPLHNLFIFLFPASIACVVASLFAQGQTPEVMAVSSGVAVHILLSIIAYSLLTMAALQALLWSWQSQQIKHHRITRAMKLFPSLQTMELLMFELLWGGVILLALGILIGFIHIDNIFAQHLVHKTVLSLLALFVFSGLLLGRHTLGWRGNTAVKWILSGCCLLMLAYFGSKLVLEIIIAR